MDKIIQIKDTEIYINGSRVPENSDADIFPIKTALNPSVIDIDLNAIYLVDGVRVVTGEGYGVYSVFFSRDGINFDLACEKNDEEEIDAYLEINKKAKTLRLLVKYGSGFDSAVIQRVEIYAEKTDDIFIEGKAEYPDDFLNSEYNVEITEADVFQAVSGVIERTVGGVIIMCASCCDGMGGTHFEKLIVRGTVDEIDAYLSKITVAPRSTSLSAT